MTNGCHFDLAKQGNPFTIPIRDFADIEDISIVEAGSTIAICLISFRRWFSQNAVETLLPRGSKRE